jgi:hypothetical protein
MKKLLFLFCVFTISSVNLFAGNGVINGKVLDEKGEPLIGATVMIEGTTNGARTDLDGKFAIRNLEDGTYNLVVSYISYDKKTLTDVIVKMEHQTISMLHL